MKKEHAEMMKELLKAYSVYQSEMHSQAIKRGLAQRKAMLQSQRTQKIKSTRR